MANDDTDPRVAYLRPFPPLEAYGADVKPELGPHYRGLMSSAQFMALLRPPCYLVDGVAQRGMTYALTGNTGAGKTAAALLLALCVTTGLPFCGRHVRQGSVLFLAGENPDNVRMQWYALCRDNERDPTELPVYWHDGQFGIDAASDKLADDASLIPNLQLVIADTLQAFFIGDDDNNNPQMIAAARSFRSLTTLPERPAVIIPAHPVKNARRDNLLPRGGSGFINEIDGNLTLWTEDGVATLHWMGKFRGPSFDPLKLEMVRTDPAGLVDDEGRQMPGTVARPVLTTREEQLTVEAISRENAALAAIAANPAISVRGLADAIGRGKSLAGEMFGKLERVHWIKRRGRDWVLTEDGKAAMGDESIINRVLDREGNL